MSARILAVMLISVVGLAAVPAQAEMLTNPGFEDLDGLGGPGDGWGSFGSAGFHAFFGPNAHASLFADTAGNFGGVFQLGIAATPGTTYTFKLTDVRIESNFDASLRFGLEYYLIDEATKIGETVVAIDTSTTGDGLSFEMSDTSPVGTAIVRPIVLFDNVNGSYSGQGQANAFVFEASLVPEPSSLVLLAGVGALMMRRRLRT